MVLDILDMEYGEIRNAIDLLNEITSNEEIFKAKHPDLIRTTNSFLQYYKDNKVDLMELVHYSEPQILDDEEDWKTDDESEIKNSPKQNLIPINVCKTENETPLVIEKLQVNSPNELKITQHEITNKINEQKYIKDLVIQSNEDFEAAEFCNTTSATLKLFYYFNKQTRRV